MGKCAIHSSQTVYACVMITQHVRPFIQVNMTSTTGKYNQHDQKVRHAVQINVLQTANLWYRQLGKSQHVRYIKANQQVQPLAQEKCDSSYTPVLKTCAICPFVAHTRSMDHVWYLLMPWAFAAWLVNGHFKTDFTWAACHRMLSWRNIHITPITYFVM